MLIKHKLFLDEIESLMRDRKEPGNDGSAAILSSLLVEMDGKRKNCYILANTNEPTKIGEYE